MAASSFHTSAGDLRDALESLQAAWLAASDEWNDAVSRRFCENHLEPLGPNVKLALDAISRMSDFVEKMHRELES